MKPIMIHKASVHEIPLKSAAVASRIRERKWNEKRNQWTIQIYLLFFSYSYLSLNHIIALWVWFITGDVLFKPA